MQALPQARPAPEIRFKGPDGAETGLADLKGRLLLVNLWATWCAPCKAEMPALDRLQAQLGGPDFPSSPSTSTPATSTSRRNGSSRPASTTSPSTPIPAGACSRRSSATPNLPGLPTTMLIDAQGCTLGVMKGPAAWSSPDGLALIRAALGRTS